MDYEQIDPIAFRAWPAAELHELGSWCLRAMGGVTRRGNSVWVGPAGGMRFGERDIDAAETWYGERGLPPRFQLSAEHHPRLDAVLSRRGYVVDAPVSLQTATLDTLLQVSAAANPAGGASVSSAPTQSWWSVIRDHWPSEPALVAIEGMLGRNGNRGLYCTSVADGEPAAAAFGVLEGEFVGVFAMHTLGSYRRAGHAQRVITALARAAASQGASRMYLQVEQANAAALALYRGRGFQESYRYHYRVRV